MEKKVGGLALLDFETNYRSTVIRLFGKDKRMDLQMEENKKCRKGPIGVWGTELLRRTVGRRQGNAPLRAGSGTFGH